QRLTLPQNRRLRKGVEVPLAEARSMLLCTHTGDEAGSESSGSYAWTDSPGCWPHRGRCSGSSERLQLPERLLLLANLLDRVVVVGRTALQPPGGEVHNQGKQRGPTGDNVLLQPDGAPDPCRNKQRYAGCQRAHRPRLTSAQDRPRCDQADANDDCAENPCGVGGERRAGQRRIVIPEGSPTEGHKQRRCQRGEHMCPQAGPQPGLRPGGLLPKLALQPHHPAQRGGDEQSQYHAELRAVHRSSFRSLAAVCTLRSYQRGGTPGSRGVRARVACSTPTPLLTGSPPRGTLAQRLLTI